MPWRGKLRVLARKIRRLSQRNPVQDRAPIDRLDFNLCLFDARFGNRTDDDHVNLIDDVPRAA